MGQGMDRVVGVDVSKAQLDAYDLSSDRRLPVANDLAGIARLVSWASPEALVVMEASGGYERLAHRRLRERGLPVAIVNRQAGARSCQGERAAGQDRPGRRPGDRPIRRVCPAGGDAAPT